MTTSIAPATAVFDAASECVARSRTPADLGPPVAADPTVPIVAPAREDRTAVVVHADPPLYDFPSREGPDRLAVARNVMLRAIDTYRSAVRNSLRTPRYSREDVERQVADMQQLMARVIE